MRYILPQEDEAEMHDVPFGELVGVLMWASTTNSCYEERLHG